MGGIYEQFEAAFPIARVPFGGKEGAAEPVLCKRIACGCLLLEPGNELLRILGRVGLGAVEIREVFLSGWVTSRRGLTQQDNSLVIVASMEFCPAA